MASSRPAKSDERILIRVRRLTKSAISLLVDIGRGLLKKRTYSRLLWQDHCPAPLPWFRFERDRAPVAALHRIVSHHSWRSAIYPRKKLNLMLLGAIWPAASAIRAARSVRLNGRSIENLYGVSRLTQWRQQVVLANTLNITPESYYAYKLFLPDRRRDAAYFIQHHEIIVLLPMLVQGRDMSQLTCKAPFHDFCQRKGLPTPPIIATIYPGNRIEWQGLHDEDLPKVDLFVKFDDYYCGIGAEAWLYEAGCHAWRGPAGMLDEIQLKQHCRSLAETEKRPVVVQTRLRNGTETAPFSRGGLCTFRVITYRSPQGEVRTLFASFRMPTGQAPVDNLSAGGIASPVDLETGMLGPAVSMDARKGDFEKHPDTGETIAGSTLPSWLAVRELAVTAHGRVDIDVAFVGWDIAISTCGLMLIEANLTWSVELVQMPSGGPIGKSPFAKCYLETMRREMVAAG